MKSRLSTCWSGCDGSDGGAAHSATMNLMPHEAHTRTLALRLSLRFNHERFCDVLYLHRKTLAVTVFVGSGALLEGRVALGLAGEPAFGPPRRPTAGFRRLGGRAQV